MWRWLLVWDLFLEEQASTYPGTKLSGDHLTIAKETARILGMTTNIFPAEYMKHEDQARQETGLGLEEIVLWSLTFRFWIRNWMNDIEI